VLGFVLIVVGGIEVLLGGSVSGLWTAFIGWFLLGAARQEGDAARVESAFGDVTVDQLMAPLPTEVPDWVPVRQLLAAPELAGRARFLAVDFGGEPTAIAAVNELPSLMAARPEPDHDYGMRLRDLDLPVPVRVEVGTPAAVAIRKMIGPLLVTRQGRPVGVVLKSDLARFLTLRRSAGYRPEPPLAAGNAV
jgi:hypothetical protein